MWNQWPFYYHLYCHDFNTFYAKRRFFLLFGHSLTNFFTIHGTWSPAVNSIPTEMQTASFLKPLYFIIITTPYKLHVSIPVTFWYTFLSFILSTLFSWSIGLNIIRFKLAANVASINTVLADRLQEINMHRNSSNEEHVKHIHKFFAWYPPLNFRIIIKGIITRIPSLTLPIIVPNNNASIIGDQNITKLSIA